MDLAYIKTFTFCPIFQVNVIHQFWHQFFFFSLVSFLSSCGFSFLFCFRPPFLISSIWITKANSWNDDFCSSALFIFFLSFFFSFFHVFYGTLWRCNNNDDDNSESSTEYGTRNTIKTYNVTIIRHENVIGCE